MLSGASLGTVMCLLLGEQPWASPEALTGLVLWALWLRGSVVDNRWRGSSGLGRVLGHVRCSGVRAEQLAHTL